LFTNLIRCSPNAYQRKQMLGSLWLLSTQMRVGNLYIIHPRGSDAKQRMTLKK
jgi:hypothetical protein